MSQELTPFEGKQPIVMKGGLVHWVTADTGTKIQDVLRNQQSHSFMKINELGIVINTAEVEGVYTMSEYEDICKIKQGMWQCEYRNWHNKGKKECNCKKEAWDRARKAKEVAARKENERELTPEEREHNIKKVREIGESLGFGKFAKTMPNNRTCIICPTKLVSNLRYYCSGGCVNKARARGIYGHEAEHQERAEALATLD